MSRLKQFTRSVVSGYALLGMNTLYTLASVPLALKYLNNSEFGLWVATLQIANFIALIDLGMGGSISRLLIDHKDDRANGNYGGMLQSGFLVCAAQGLIAMAAGFSLLSFLGGWLRVPQELARPFFWLMSGQIIVTGGTFLTRIFSHILYAWQRIDICNYASIAQLVTGFAALCVAFAMNLGVFNFLVAAFVNWLCGAVVTAGACMRLELFPGSGEWGRASKRQFRDLFNYGSEVFLISIGIQFIISSQTVLVSRQLGMEAAALWSVMTRAFTLASQSVWRIVGNAMPAFAEMQSRNELGRLWSRYREFFIAASVFAGVGGVLFAACNSSFVTIWTSGKFSWPARNNLYLSLWLIVSTQQCCHNSLIIWLKDIKRMKYVFIIEGIAFVAVSLVVLRYSGLSGMLICSLAATLIFTWAFGVAKIGRISHLGLKPLLWTWQKPLLMVLIIMTPLWLALQWTLADVSDVLQLLIKGSLLTAMGAWLFVLYGLPPNVVAGVFERLPPSLRTVAAPLLKKQLIRSEATPPKMFL